ncbi:hypothetical protein Tco_0257275 [Tanacetum coccineum]
MAESSPKKTSSPEITPKEEPATLDKPESPNPFLPASQVDFTFDESCTLKAFTRAPNQYKEYVSEVWYTTKTLDDSKVCISSPTGGVRGDIGITTFRNALRAQYLPHSSGKTGGLNQISNKDATILYCLANGLQVDYAKIIWEDLIHKLNKKTREKIIPYPSVHNLTLKPNQPEEPPFTDHMKAICNLDVPVDSKAPKPSSQTEEFPHVVGEMHQEAHQVAGGSTSLGSTSKEGAHPQLSSGYNPSVLVDKTKSVRDGLKTTHTDSGANEESRADDISLNVKIEDLSDLLKDTRSVFFTPDSPPNEPIIISDESEEEEEVAKDKDTEATSHDVPKDTSVLPPPSLKSA